MRPQPADQLAELAHFQRLVEDMVRPTRSIACRRYASRDSSSLTTVAPGQNKPGARTLGCGAFADSLTSTTSNSTSQ